MIDDTTCNNYKFINAYRHRHNTHIHIHDRDTQPAYTETHTHTMHNGIAHSYSNYLELRFTAIGIKAKAQLIRIRHLRLNIFEPSCC